MENRNGWGLGGSWGVIYIVLRLPRPRTLGHQSPGVGAEPTGRPVINTAAGGGARAAAAAVMNGLNKQERCLIKESGGTLKQPREEGKKKKKPLSKEIYPDCVDTTHTHTHRGTQSTLKNPICYSLYLSRLLFTPLAPSLSPCQTTQPPRPEPHPGTCTH